MSERHRHILFFTLLIVIALGAMTTLYFCTTAGLGFGNDSVAYVGAARNILDGNGYARTSGGGEIKPITHYPPLFSLTLAAGSALTHYDPVRVARVLIILLWGLGAFLGGWLAWRMSGSRPAGLFFALLFATNGPLLFVYALIMSEPLYLALSFAAFLFLLAYFVPPHIPPFSLQTGIGAARRAENGGTKGGLPWLLAAGIASGLAYLTRYSGLALLGTIVAVLLLLEPGWKKKIRAVLIYLGGALPFMLAWTLRNTLQGLSVTNRELGYHAIPAEKIDFGVRQLWDWLLPGWFGDFTATWPLLSILRTSRDWPATPYIVISIVGLGLLAWLALNARRLWNTGSRHPSLALFFSSTLYLFVYLAAIVFSLFYFDASTPFHDRILAPVYISLLAAFVTLIARLWRTDKRWLQAAVIVLALIVTSISLADASRAFARLQTDPLGYASARWRNSKTVATIAALPADTIIYSNAPTGVYILTGRPAYIMPTLTDPVDNQPRESYAGDVAQLRAELRAGGVVLVVFQPEQENAERLAKMTEGIPLYFKAGDGLIFGQP